MATQNQQERTASLLLARGADPSIKDKFGYSALHYAAMRNMTRFAKKLLEYGMDVEDPDRYGERPLALAVDSRAYDIIRLFLAWGADPRQGMRPSMDPEAESLLFPPKTDDMNSAIEAGNLEKATRFAESMDLRNAEYWNGPGPMGSAAGNGSVPMIEMLMAHGASVNEVTMRTAPHSAISFALEAGKLEAAKFLVDKGASAIEALDYAIEKGNDDLFNFALGKARGVNDTDLGGRTPLMRASTAGRLDFVQALLKKGADVNALSGEPYIYEWEDSEEAYANWLEQGKGDALSLAIAGKFADIVKLILVQKGVKPSVYALEAALKSGDGALASDLLNRGAKPRDASLVAACEGQLPKIVAQFLAKGISPNAKGFERKTAADVALELGNMEILQMLSDKGARPWKESAGYFTVNDDRVNVRDFPDTTAGKVLRQLNSGDYVETIGETLFTYTIGGSTDRWYKIKGEPAGWVFGAFLKYYWGK